MNQCNQLLIVALTAACSACAGAPDADITGATTETIQVPQGTEPLAPFEPTDWLDFVRPSCEDFLPREVEFQLIYEGHLIALDSWGLPVCHDRVENIHAELIATGRADESRALEHAYLVAVGIGVPVRRGDPSPQPSVHGARPCRDPGGRRHDHLQLADPTPDAAPEPDCPSRRGEPED